MTRRSRTEKEAILYRVSQDTEETEAHYQKDIRKNNGFLWSCVY
jgi:hypothetical protein